MSAVPNYTRILRRTGALGWGEHCLYSVPSSASVMAHAIVRESASKDGPVVQKVGRRHAREEGQ